MRGVAVLMGLGVGCLERIESGENEDTVRKQAHRLLVDVWLQQFPENSASEVADIGHEMGAMVRIGYAWARNAFVRIEPAHKLAASLMCTTISADAIEGLALPWPCFVIDVPSGLVTSSDPNREVVFLAVEKGESPNGGDAFGVTAFTEKKVAFMLVADSIKQFAEGNVPPGGAAMEALPATIHGEEARRIQLLRNLVLGVLVEMSSAKNREAARAVPKQPKMKRGAPRSWSFVLGRPVKLDVRNEVLAYVLGRRGKALTVQTLVVGHFKRQHYGPQNSLVRRQHIEPYWRGPEDAPIVVRPHQLGE